MGDEAVDHKMESLTNHVIGITANVSQNDNHQISEIPYNFGNIIKKYFKYKERNIGIALYRCLVHVQIT